MSRPYADTTQSGKRDRYGVQWWAGDPYPTWYRYDDDTGALITCDPDFPAPNSEPAFVVVRAAPRAPLLHHVQQINASSCAHACIAMLTGESVPDLWSRFPHPLGWAHIMPLLVERRILGHAYYGHTGAAGAPCEFNPGVYLAEVASLNNDNGSHLVVLVVAENGIELLDPNKGRRTGNGYWVRYWARDVFMQDQVERPLLLSGVRLDFASLAGCREFVEWGAV